MHPKGFHGGETAVREIDLGGRMLRLRAPAAPERLLDAIDAAAFRADEKMPYWAELWPAAIAFARHLLLAGSHRPPLRGKGVLEMGCGLGLVGIAAALAGAREVTFSDYFSEALEFAAENAARNGVTRWRTLLLDWREPSGAGCFEAIVGADLLYETRNLEPVAAAIDAALAPGGTAWIADPDRITAAEFAAGVAARRLAIERRAIARGVSLYRIEKPL